MRFLVFLIFSVSAWSQTKLSFEIFSLTDPDYRRVLEEEKNLVTGKDLHAQAILEFMLSSKRVSHHAIYLTFFNAVRFSDTQNEAWLHSGFNPRQVAV